METEKPLWPEAIHVLRQSTYVMGVLRWSYDTLAESEKLMFLDIICLFYDQRVEEAFAYWQGCKNSMLYGGTYAPHTSLRNRIQKNLVVARYVPIAYFQVHDLLRDLGQDIAMKAKRHFVDDRITKGTFVENQVLIEIIGVDLARSWKRKFKVENFANMPNLHYLRFPDGCNEDLNFECMPKKLQLIQWRSMPFVEIPMGLSLSFLTSLDFSRSSILASLLTNSNDTLEACPNLVRFNLEWCTSITKLPDSIGQLSQLHHLNLYGCKELKKLPNSVGHLEGLEELILGHCTSLQALPETTANPNLRRLNLIECESISKLPESIGQLKALQTLNLFGCDSLKALPDSIGALSDLQFLDTTGCTSLVKIPTSIGLLSSLRTLEIEAECQPFTDGLIGGGWTQLRYLRLENWGGVGSLLDYGALKSLNTLYLHDHTLTELPESFELLTRLSYLRISCERLQCLAKSIGDFKMLETLELVECHNLRRLPKTLGALTNLQHLEVGCCKSLVKIPTSIGLLSSLRSLEIRASTECQPFTDGNVGGGWTQLQNVLLENWGGVGSLLEYGALKSVEALYLCDSTLTELPEDFGLLTRLSTLKISCERLRCLPRSIGGLKMLKTQELRYCDNLRRLPKVLGALTSLKRLDIGRCLIRKLPKSIDLLSRLSSLTLEGCKNLQKLPTTIRQLESLTYFRIEVCGSIEAIGALTTLQDLRIWGSTSITKLPASLATASTLVVYEGDDIPWYAGDLFEIGTYQVLEEDEAGFLRAYQDEPSGVTRLLRGAHKKHEIEAVSQVAKAQCLTGCLNTILQPLMFQVSFLLQTGKCRQLSHFLYQMMELLLMNQSIWKTFSNFHVRGLCQSTCATVLLTCGD